LTVNVELMDGEFQLSVTRRFPDRAVSESGIAGATVGLRVPPPPVPQAGSRRPISRNPKALDRIVVTLAPD
jgi:hypothetical protein